MSLLFQVAVLQPRMVANPETRVTLMLEVSRGLRTLMAWYREVKKPCLGQAPWEKRANAAEREVIWDTVKDLVLENPKNGELTEWHPVGRLDDDEPALQVRIGFPD